MNYQLVPVLLMVLFWSVHRCKPNLKLFVWLWGGVVGEREQNDFAYKTKTKHFLCRSLEARGRQEKLKEEHRRKAKVNNRLHSA